MELEEEDGEDPKFSEGSNDRRDLALVAVSGGSVDIMVFAVVFAVSGDNVQVAIPAAAV